MPVRQEWLADSPTEPGSFPIVRRAGLRAPTIHRGSPFSYEKTNEEKDRLEIQSGSRDTEQSGRALMVFSSRSAQGAFIANHRRAKRCYRQNVGDLKLFSKIEVNCIWYVRATGVCGFDISQSGQVLCCAMGCRDQEPRLTAADYAKEGIFRA